MANHRPFVIPDQIKSHLLKNLVDQCSELARRTMGDESTKSVNKLADDKSFVDTFNDTLDKALARFVQVYGFEDEDVVKELADNSSLWECKSVKGALLRLVKRPSVFIDDENRRRLTFEDVLPHRLNRGRVNKAMHYLFNCLAGDVWGLGAFRPIYQLQLKQPSVATEYDKLPQATDQLPGPVIQVKHCLPNPDYTEFIGREKEFNDLVALLRPYPLSQYHVISIDGVGGVGKTALAMRIAYHFVRNAPIINSGERFDAVIWTSAKRSTLEPTGIRNRSRDLRNLGDIFTAISRTLERPEILSVGQEQQESLVRYILSKSRILLIVDNLETVDDTRVLSFLRDLPAPTKILLTTRHRSIGGAFPFRVKGMEKEDILALIDQECKNKRVEITLEDKVELAKRTAGVPLAAVWTIGQISRGHSIDKALLRLHSASKDYAKFVFSESMDLLRRNNKGAVIKLLMGLSLFVDGATREALGYVCGLQGGSDDRDENLSDLFELSLINYENGRFSMLSLTREYATQEMAQDLEFQQEATDRWFDWHVRLAEQGGGGKLDLDASVLGTLKAEHTNILWVINSSFTHERFDVFVKLLRGMGFYWMGTGYWNDYENYYNKGRMLAPDLNDRIHFAVRLVWLNILMQNFARAKEMLDFSQHLLEDCPNPYEQMRWEDYCGQLNMELGQFSAAETHLIRSLELARQIKDRRGQFACLKYLGELYCRKGDAERARAYLKEAEPYAAGTGEDQWIRGLAHAAQLRGIISLVEENWKDAAVGFQNCIDYLEIWPDERLLTRARLGLSFAKYQLGSYDDARTYLEANRVVYEKLGMISKAMTPNEIFDLWREEAFAGFWESM